MRLRLDGHWLDVVPLTREFMVLDFIADAGFLFPL